jgi:cytochrome bd-type quinol oxidase subunit 2
MQRLVKALGFTFAEKAIKSKSLISSFSFHILVSLIILGKHLSIQTWWNYLHPTILRSSLFNFLLYAAKGLSSLNLRERRTIPNRISNLARINLTHTLGAPLSHSQATFGFSFRFMNQCHSPRLQRIPHLCTCDVVQLIYIFLSLRESGRYVHLPGREVTRLAAYHIYGMWLVLSNA